MFWSPGSNPATVQTLNHMHHTSFIQNDNFVFKIKYQKERLQITDPLLNCVQKNSDIDTVKLLYKKVTKSWKNYSNWRWNYLFLGKFCHIEIIQKNSSSSVHSKNSLYREIKVCLIFNWYGKCVTQCCNIWIFRNRKSANYHSSATFDCFYNLQPLI